MSKVKPETQKVANSLEGEPFFDLPSNLQNRTPNNLRAWLQRSGFTKVQEARSFRKKDGSVDWKSEIWYRLRSDPKARGKVEAVRLDEHGHNVNPEFAGAKSHAHADLVDFAESQVYLNEYVPELPAPYRAGGAPVPKYAKPGDFAKSKGKPTNKNYFPDTHNRTRPGTSPGSSSQIKRPGPVTRDELDPGMQYPVRKPPAKKKSSP